MYYGYAVAWLALFQCVDRGSLLKFLQGPALREGAEEGTMYVRASERV